MEDNIKLMLSLQEKIKCLEEIIKKIKKILYVYDKSQEADSNYDYKVYVTGVLFYVKSSDNLFSGDLVSIMVNLNSILINDFSKKQLKRIVLETKNIAEYCLRLTKEEGSE